MMKPLAPMAPSGLDESLWSWHLTAWHLWHVTALATEASVADPQEDAASPQLWKDPRNIQYGDIERKDY